MIYSISLSKKSVGMLLAIAMLFGFVVLPTVALGQAEDPAADPAIGGCSTALDCKVTGQTCKGSAAELAAGTGTCVKDTFGLNPVGNEVKGTLGNKDLRETAASLINVLLGLLGLIAVVIVLAGGFKWMTAGGSDDKIGEARKMIFSGVIGLAIIMSAWAISLFVINQLTTATGGASTNIPDDIGG